jgi:hypothetical protein
VTSAGQRSSPEAQPKQNVTSDNGRPCRAKDKYCRLLIVGCARHRSGRRPRGPSAPASRPRGRPGARRSRGARPGQPRGGRAVDCQPARRFPVDLRASASDRAVGRAPVQHTGCSAAWLARLLWEQEAAGSNPAIPTKHATRRARWRTPVLVPRLSDRHLTVELNAIWRQRLSRTGPTGHPIWPSQLLVLNKGVPGSHPRFRLREERGDRCRPLKAVAPAPLTDWSVHSYDADGGGCGR